jgi:hypothetical protein
MTAPAASTAEMRLAAFALHPATGTVAAGASATGIQRADEPPAVTSRGERLHLACAGSRRVIFLHFEAPGDVDPRAIHPRLTGRWL